jgi:hypothetical protein
MKHRLSSRIGALALALCLLFGASPAAADTYLPDGTVTHADFICNLALHADGFPASTAHLSAWETFLQKISLSGSADVLAPFTPDSRVYVNGTLQLNGKNQLPFVYDGYHSYRYVTSPALNNVSLFFQMHNYLEFMLKPYYYMNLPTQYLALLTYPDAAYWIGESYYQPIADLLASARQDAMNGTATNEAQADNAAATNATADDTDATADDTDTTDATADDTDTTDATTDDTDDTSMIADIAAAPLSTAVASNADSPSTSHSGVLAASDALTYTVPYEDLYELCENLDQLVNDENDNRAYFFFTCLLTDLYASDMALSVLGNLEGELDALDPDQNGLTVTQSESGVTMTLGSTNVFTQTVTDGKTALTLTLPTAEGYTLTFTYDWTPGTAGAALNASLRVTQDGADALLLKAQGENLPQAGDLGGQGSLTLTASGSVLAKETPPMMFNFMWSRDSLQRPYTLNLNVDWIHPQTLKPALSFTFNGKLSTVDKSVFVEGSYPQNDFFNLNETFLDDYKAKLMPTLTLKLVPFVLEMPAGVIDDLYRFADSTDILVSFLE